MDIRIASPPPQPFTRRPRDPSGIRQVQWHATRGATSMDRQVSATESGFASPAHDRGGWGGSADFGVGPDPRVAGPRGGGEVWRLVAVSAARREDAFAAALRTVDRVKETVPVLKKEYGPDGATWQEGVEPKPSFRATATSES